MGLSLRSSRLVRSVAAAAALLVVASGCGTGNSSGGTSNGEVTLRFAWWGNDVRNKQTQQVIDAFQTSHPNIKIKGEPGTWANYWDKLATQTAAHDAPDVVQMDQQYIAEYGGRGALLDLSKQGGIDTSKMDPGELASGQYKGKLYGLSTGENAYALMANTKVFTDAGVALPDDSTWTWDDYTKTAAALAAAGGKNGAPSYGASFSGTADLIIWLRQHGEALYDDAGNLGFKNETAASFWQQLVKQRDAKAGPPASVALEDSSATPEQSLFATGKTGLAWAWTNQVNVFQTAVGNEVKLLRAPSADGKAQDAGLFFKPSMFWSASGATKHPAETAEFINYLANSTDVAKIVGAERGFPFNAEKQAMIDPTLKPADKAAEAFLLGIKPDVKTPFAVPPVGTGGLDSLLHRTTEDVLFNRTTPEQAAKSFAEQLQSMINSAKK